MTRSGRVPLPRLIVMTRYPRAGSTKMRLAPLLGEEGAAALHSDLARHCIRRMHATSLSGVADLDVHVSGSSARDARRWLGRRVRVLEQVDGDLGDRLAGAARHAFDSGAPAVVLVGSDAPGLGGDHVRAALAGLADAECVLGPATDGGYYLIALAERSAGALPDLFGPHVPWGTGRVAEITLDAARARGLVVRTLDPLPDIDRPQDVAIWETLLAEKERMRRDPRLSVIIPALNEEAEIESAIENARGVGALEVVVADGGSTDRTAARASAAGAIVVHSTRGRARQLNAGAAEATGDILLFLHADTRLPPHARDDVRSVLASEDVVLGSFRFAAGDPDVLTDRIISGAGALRHRLFGLPYGDQAPFIRAEDFRDLGGFPDLPVMEDYEFGLRCSRLGGLGVTASAARTSARAWHEYGLARTTLTNAAVIAGYRGGISPDTLAGWRRRIADRSSGCEPTGRGSERGHTGRPDPR